MTIKLAAHVAQLVADLIVIIKNDHDTAIPWGMGLVPADLYKGQVTGVMAMRDLDDADLVTQANYTGPRFLAQDLTIYEWLNHEIAKEDMVEFFKAVQHEVHQYFSDWLSTPEGMEMMMGALGRAAAKRDQGLSTAEAGTQIH